MSCPICGEKDGACHGTVPVRLTADQLKDLGLTPDKLPEGGTITVNDQEPKARYPKQEVADGQKHGYIGNVEVYEPPEADPGYSNADGDAPKSTASRSTTTRQTAADAAPKAKPVSGAQGTLGGDTSK